jgi:hypothetical protein
MKFAPKSIIISGTTRNIGKTSFACRLIEKYKSEGVIAIKISPHFHTINSDAIIIENNEEFIIVKEHRKESNKDSSRMLKAGAKEVYFIMTKDESLYQVVEFLSGIIDFNSRIIIESAAIRRYIKPQIFYLIYNNENPTVKSQNEDLESLIDIRVNSKEIF